MSNLRYAISLPRKGCKIFPIHSTGPNRKKPCIRGWPQHATPGQKSSGKEFIQQESVGTTGIPSRYRLTGLQLLEKIMKVIGDADRPNLGRKGRENRFQTFRRVVSTRQLQASVVCDTNVTATLVERRTVRRAEKPPSWPIGCLLSHSEVTCGLSWSAGCPAWSRGRRRRVQRLARSANNKRRN